MTTKRLFISLPLPEAVKTLFLEALKDQSEKIWRFAKKDNLHITAIFLGDMDVELVQKKIQPVG